MFKFSTFKIICVYLHAYETLRYVSPFNQLEQVRGTPVKVPLDGSIMGAVYKECTQIK
jgi:hypothetical protein